MFIKLSIDVSILKFIFKVDKKFKNLFFFNNVCAYILFINRYFLKYLLFLKIE